MTTAFGFNQVLDSTFAIPGAIQVAGSIGTQSIRISAGPAQPNASRPLYMREGNALMFNAPNVASYRCQTDRIEVQPCPLSDPEWVTNLLVATALPAALWMQGRFVLHAAAVVPKGEGRCIAIAGASGAGKSVLAKQLLEQGASLLADDSVALDITDDGVMASGLPGGIYCRTGDGDERNFEPVSPGRSVRFAPLGAIILLEGFADSFASSALDKVTAIEKLLACQHRPRIPAALGRSGPALAQAAIVADRVPVSIWRRCHSDFTVSAMERDLLSAMLDGQIRS